MAAGEGDGMNWMEYENSLEDRRDARAAGYAEGLEVGLRMYAWWKDGTQYVGSCGTTLQEALQKVREEEKP